MSSQPIADARFHWWATGAHLWILAGLFLDGWYHINDSVETFFTPWHGVLYSGVAVAVAVIAEQMLRGRRRGLSRRESVPAGYGLAVIGGGVFVAGAMADMVWHEVLGIEVGVEALLSPTHLTLAIAGFLVFTGPLRAAQRTLDPGAPAAAIWPSVVSVAFVVTLIAFFTQYVNPLTHLYPLIQPRAGNADLLNAAGITGYVLHAATVAGAVLVLLLRWRLPRGAVLAVVLIPAMFMATQRATFELLPGVLMAGLAAEALVAWLRPAADRTTAARIVGAAVPALLTSAILITLAATGQVVWSMHLLTGAVALSALAGALIGILMTAPAAPHRANDQASSVRSAGMPEDRTGEPAEAVSR